MIERGWSIRVLVRYTLLQLPALAVIILVLVLIRRWLSIPWWLSWGFVALWVLKDIALFPFVWRSYDSDRSQDANSMIGARGIAKERLAPSGYVEAGGALWQAQVMEGARPIEKGESVQVREIRGLILLVEPENQDIEQ